MTSGQLLNDSTAGSAINHGHVAFASAPPCSLQLRLLCEVRLPHNAHASRSLVGPRTFTEKETLHQNLISQGEPL